MADNNNPKTNTGILAKAQKRLSRTKTKVLQNLGKADKTKDEAFNSHVTQLEELQERTQPLHKELNHYVSCVKKPFEFSKDQDRLLLQEAVTVQPFSKGKGQGWKMIASKLTKSNQFPVMVKTKAVRERILKLMEDYSQNESTQEYVSDSQDDDMNENLQQLVVLRDEAVKMATQNWSLNNIEMEQATSDKRANLEAEQEVEQPRQLTTKSVGEDSALKGGAKHPGEDAQQNVPEPSGLQSKAKTDLCQASKSLQHSFQTVYEDGWPEKELMQEQLKTCDLLWNDYIQNLQDSVASPLNSFLHHFPAFKAKISKRGRKLVDYDNARHQLEVLNSAKKRDEVKIEKAQEDLKDAKKIYEEMNQELLSEMPAFYNSRCHFVSTLFTSLFGAEFLFHSEIGKVSASVGDSCQKFSSQSEPMDFKLNTSMSVNENGTSGLSSPPTPCSSEPPTSPQATDSPSPLYLNQIGQQDKQAEKDDKLNGVNDGDDNDDDKDDDTEDTDTDSENQQPSQVVVLARDESPSPQTVKSEGNYVKLCHDDEDEDEGHVDQVKEESNLYEEPASPTVPVKGVANGKGVSDDDDDDDDDEEEEEDDDDDSNVYTDTPINTPVHQPPPNTLYQVQATHRYTGEDVDELNFEPGEMIYVIKFENSEEQDEGWQMGIKQSDGVKGVFPENFTRKI